jgi:hypothetical protein
VALEFEATGIGESFKAKPPDLAALEVCLKEVVLCAPVGVLNWQRSVTEGPLSFRVLIVASPVRWSRGGTCLAQGRVHCVPYAVAFPPVFAILLVLLMVALT